MSKHTPGPFEAFGDYMIQSGGSRIAMKLPKGPLPREELVDLLNKGTHFDEMLGALQYVLGYLRGGSVMDSVMRELAVDCVQKALAKVEGKT